MFWLSKVTNLPQILHQLDEITKQEWCCCSSKKEQTLLFSTLPISCKQQLPFWILIPHVRIERLHLVGS